MMKGKHTAWRKKKQTERESDVSAESSNHRSTSIFIRSVQLFFTVHHLSQQLIRIPPFKLHLHPQLQQPSTCSSNPHGPVMEEAVRRLGNTRQELHVAVSILVESSSSRPAVGEEDIQGSQRQQLQRREIQRAHSSFHPEEQLTVQPVAVFTEAGQQQKGGDDWNVQRMDVHVMDNMEVRKGSPSAEKLATNMEVDEEATITACIKQLGQQHFGGDHIESKEGHGFYICSRVANPNCKEDVQSIDTIKASSSSREGRRI
ncbi:hypothetical protein LR48_Vigan09g113900 [Vigna angularis]|uniref:Uncharacterized protein n=1 Tax=Phaseolus angularis TaxID=3914 RepID=A0A0L9VBQ1_PHAAN|nr:hypothetical protein LR48_Vigan09g113900 [Vigna angularis]